ncbi:hypothetical protein GDO81_005256 [Engystomops pustulosus]|uniref:Uncharacterized protein n=1 Tax=Engystomops pustulosus TaxID=76066 RepID=A0AAV7CM50_ENGPU|nr:hypothetical protein GDO81_005256 [Engystomops pustulosus]
MQRRWACAVDGAKYCPDCACVLETRHRRPQTLKRTKTPPIRPAGGESDVDVTSAEEEKGEDAASRDQLRSRGKKTLFKR